MKDEAVAALIGGVVLAVTGWFYAHVAVVDIFGHGSTVLLVGSLEVLACGLATVVVALWKGRLG